VRDALRQVGPLVALTGLALAWLACNAVLGIDPPEHAAPANETGGDGGDDDAGCHARWPGRPTIEDGDGKPDRTLLFAINYIEFDPKTVTVPLGYDLDDTCTCIGTPAGPESCNRHPEATTPRCDEASGRDIAFNVAALPVLAKSKGFNEDQLRNGLRNGAYGILVGVSGWNGGSNDKTVRISVFFSSGFATGDAGVDAASEAGPAAGQAWDIDPSSVTSGDAGFEPRARYFDDNAYVTNGVVVASRLLGAQISLGTGRDEILIDVSQSVLTAKVGKDSDGNYVLSDGQIAGRWPTKNVLKTVAGLQDPLSDSGRSVCDDPAKIAYTLAKSTICGAADIANRVDLDNTGAVCDAISLGISFTAKTATFGKERPHDIGRDGGCWQTWSDDCTP
jgi:hypothetical protein